MTLEEAKKIIFDRKPEFAKLYNEYGSKTWLDYSKENYDIKGLPDNKRTNDLLVCLEKILKPLIGQTETINTIKTLKETSLVSSADHHGILCHPFFSNTTLVRSFCIQDSLKTDDYKPSTISLTCGCISPSNSSYPRGIFFHDDNFKEVKMPFLSLRDRRRSLYGIKALNKISFKKQKDRLTHINLNDSEKSRLNTFFDKIIEDEKIFDQKLLSSQYTIINDILWKELFDTEHGNLVYLEIETLIRELILTYHIDNITEVHKIMFDSETRNNYIKNFEGVVGAHNTETKKGSHIFWYIDEIKNTRKQLFVKNNSFESIDGKTIIEINKENIRKGLLEYRLIPSMALCYSIIAFYYGFTLGGGFSQIQYLGDMKNAFKKTVTNIADTKTNIFTGEFVLETLNKDGSVLPASLIDILIRKDNINGRMFELMRNTKIANTLDLMMTEFIEIVTGKKENIVI